MEKPEFGDRLKKESLCAALPSIGMRPSFDKLAEMS